MSGVHVLEQQKLDLMHGSALLLTPAATSVASSFLHLFDTGTLLGVSLLLHFLTWSDISKVRFLERKLFLEL